MAFSKIATLPGFNRSFSMNPDCRPYTLRDNGFEDTRGGNFQYKRKLDVENKKGLVLKVTINKDLTQLKISTVTSNGMTAVDVTQLNNNAMVVEKINFIFDGFVDRNVFNEEK